MNANPATLGATVPAARVLARFGWSDHDVWRETLPAVPLYAMSTDGALDAPETLPAGSMVARQRNGKPTPCRAYCPRESWA